MFLFPTGSFVGAKTWTIWGSSRTQVGNTGQGYTSNPRCFFSSNKS
uniref:Uncharacterized protein n=1 Tax=Paramormyrops kingsleyae TaxID=1676925 RepID=A0A3B3RM15_9TELE